MTVTDPHVIRITGFDICGHGKTDIFYWCYRLYMQNCLVGTFCFEKFGQNQTFQTVFIIIAYIGLTRARSLFEKVAKFLCLIATPVYIWKRYTASKII